MQAIHCTSDGPFVITRLGRERAEAGAYVWQKLMKSGAVVANGTDTPVEDVDPVQCYYAAVSRRLKDGTVFFPDQRMSRMEALRSYTINNAFAAFEDGSKGSLKVGEASGCHGVVEGYSHCAGERGSLGEGGLYDRGWKADVRKREALVPVAPLAHLFAHTLAFFAGSFTPGLHFLPALLAESSGLFSCAVPSLQGFFPGFAPPAPILG